MAKIASELTKDNGGKIAVNDLGFVALYSRTTVFYLWGLAQQDVCDLKCSGRYSGNALKELINRDGVKYVMIYDKWFKGKLEIPNLIYVAKLSIDGNTICGDDTVTFYAVDMESSIRMKQCLNRYVKGKIPSSTHIFFDKN